MRRNRARRERNNVDGIEVDGTDGEKLGDVEGFVIDVMTGRPRHVAVRAGWLFHKHFLLPIGHVRLREDRSKPIADVTRERVDRFPGFDKDEFEQLTADQLRQFDETRLEPAVRLTMPRSTSTAITGRRTGGTRRFTRERLRNRGCEPRRS